MPPTHRRDETTPPFITANAEMGSATSRNPPGRRHNVRLSAPTDSIIVAGGLSERAALRMAEAINDFVAKALDDHAPEPPTCPRCATAVHWGGRGRPPAYCSPACRQQAYRDRLGP
jgi:tRNA(Ile2) C34 agmatinyltransferase TiaS